MTTALQTGDECVVRDGDVAAMQAILDEARAWGILGIDLEWNKDGRITWIGLGTKHRAVSFWRAGLSPAALDLARAAMADATLPKLIHNLQADKTVWEREIGPMNGRIEDTMLMHHAAFPGIAHDLQQVVSQFLVVPPWKAWRRKEVEQAKTEARETTKANKKTARMAAHEARNAAKAAEKAAREAEKAAERAAKETERAAERARKLTEKEAEKAARIAAHNARNAALKAEKEARKAAKKKVAPEAVVQAMTGTLQAAFAPPVATVTHPVADPAAQPPTVITVSPVSSRPPWKAVKLPDDTPCAKCGNTTRPLYKINLNDQWLCEKCYV